MQDQVESPQESLFFEIDVEMCGFCGGDGEDVEVPGLCGFLDGQTGHICFECLMVILLGS